jgi:putative phage-type endonuclease
MEIDVEQRSKEWLDIRKTKITGTDAAVIMGLNPWKTPYKLWCQKLNLAPEDVVNVKMQSGAELEVEAREVYEMITGNKVKPSVHVSDEYPWMMCSTDGMTDDGKILVEIKCGSKALDQCRKGDIPNYYMAQIQHSLCCTGADECHFFCYMPLEGESVTIVQRDEKFIAEMLAVEKEFYSLIANRTPPDLEEKDFVIITDEDFGKAAARWRIAKAALKAAEEEEKIAKTILLDFTDDSNCRGFGLKLTSISRTNIDYKKAIEDHNIDIVPYMRGLTRYYKITEE